MIDKITKSIEMDQKQTPSAKVYNTIGFVSALLSGALFIISLIILPINFDIGLKVFTNLFYPIAIFLIIGLFCSIVQILRNRFFIATITLIISITLLAGLIAYIICQAVILKQVHIVPFIYL